MPTTNENGREYVLLEQLQKVRSGWNRCSRPQSLFLLAALTIFVVTLIYQPYTAQYDSLSVNRIHRFLFAEDNNSYLLPDVFIRQQKASSMLPNSVENNPRLDGKDFPTASEPVLEAEDFPDSITQSNIFQSADITTTLTIGTEFSSKNESQTESSKPIDRVSPSVAILMEATTVHPVSNLTYQVDVHLKPSHVSNNTKLHIRNMILEEIQHYRPPSEVNPTPLSYLSQYREYLKNRLDSLFHPLSGSSWNSPENIQKILIVSTFRSGSSFMGDLASSHPLSFYFFEPGGALLRGPKYSTTKLRLIRDLFNCDFNSTGQMKKASETLHFRIQQNSLVNNIIANMSDIHQKLWFAREACLLSTYRVVKTVRVALADFQPIIGDPNVKVIFLSRDPRGTINSRDNQNWCIEACRNITFFCDELRNNSQLAQEIQQTHPQLFRIIRLETFIKNAAKSTKELFDFLGTPIEEQTLYFLLERTGQLRAIHEYINSLDFKERFAVLTQRIRQISRGEEIANTISSNWRTKISWERALEAQNSCSTAMKTLKYKPVQTEQQLRNNSFHLFSY